MFKGKGHVIPGVCRRKREQQPNDKTDDGRARRREGALADDECDTTRNETNHDGPWRTCSGLIAIEPRGRADEERQRVDCETEQRPTGNAQPDNIEKNADDDQPTCSKR